MLRNLPVLVGRISLIIIHDLKIGERFTKLLLFNKVPDLAAIFLFPESVWLYHFFGRNIFVKFLIEVIF